MEIQNKTKGKSRERDILRQVEIHPEGPFTRAILHVVIVILVYVMNSWQSI